ncbi:MAG: MolR family transcriptional regulator [Proteobacteria bacterium]|jgi:putative molybdopterin biosynthesis protein|nr:MolR family transcriptional regulator [Pseudomonadota bacterium]MDA0958548.1 MolR family transcriptional regulator [Pseudomonadota bacterium]MDA1206985.1 MolR family transcriptional regulator [Pseudomonadota bacterium]
MSKRIYIRPSWSFHDDQGQTLNPQLLALLRGIQETGKLTKATQLIGISYRHGWNLLNQAEQFFSSSVVLLEKGRGARLSTLGEKLLWAERRVAARLTPQMENIASALNIEIHKEIAEASPLLRLHASHGYAVALLPDFAAGFQLDLQYKSPVDALAALGRGVCDLAGIHVPADIRIESLMTRYASYLNPKDYQVIRFITRQQGLMVAPGNPYKIKGIKDLGRPALKLINRQPDSGTRALLDCLVADANLETTAINGYLEEEFTHTAVAAFVAAGMADIGFGVEAAARQFGLDFIDITREHYLIICHRQTLKLAACRAFLEQIRSLAFTTQVEALPGYQSTACGSIEPLDRHLW